MNFKGCFGSYASRDMGGDAHTSGLDKYAGADVYGYSLGYFSGDYTPISGTAFANTDALITANGANGNLYNGNISHMVTAMKDDAEAMINVLGNNYKYDQLNRIKSSDSYWVSNQATYISNNSFSGAVNYNSGGYAEAYWFDKNGNLDSLTRKNSAGTFYDNFSYNYHATTKNRLLSVDDAGGNSSVAATDIDDQNTNNYSYNAIGQLTADSQENITSIDWTVTGKVRKVSQGDSENTEFIYDAMGNRVMKITEGINEVNAVYTYYVYDASGNLMATYQRTVAIPFGETDYRDQLKLGERMIYGSKRLGVKNENREMTRFDFTPSSVNGNGFYQAYSSSSAVTEYPQNFVKEKRKAGEKMYEFSEHRGNVMNVTTDRKIGNTGETAYEADVISYQDFSPYGTILDGRSGSTDLYRYGFQGQEDDSEIKGEGNSVNYKYRMHDPRLGRFFALDPLTHLYPMYSPYHFSSNQPIHAPEIEGKESQNEMMGINDPIWRSIDPNMENYQENREIFYDAFLEGHSTLDLMGMIPLIGEAFDGINAAWYAAEGNTVDATLSMASMIPIVGWVSTGAKYTKNAIKIVVKEGEGIMTKVISNADVWTKLNPFDRGKLIESIYSQSKYILSEGWENIGAAMKGYFPAIDFWNEAKNAVISIKTIGTNALKEANFGDFYKNIDDMADAQYIIHGKVYNPTKTLEIVVPEGANVEGLQDVINYGAERGVNVITSEF